MFRPRLPSGIKAGAGIVLALGLLTVSSARAEPPATVTIQLIRPDEELGKVLEWFQGARARHPAAALAAWRHATGSPEGLGKTTEALISLFNPDMVSEFRAFDDAEIVLGWRPPGEPYWQACLECGDGTLEALLTALCLTDGASEAPLDGRSVDRLGPPGSPLALKDGRRIILAGSRIDLAPRMSPARPLRTEGRTSGIAFRIDPTAGPTDVPGLPEAGLVLKALEAVGCTDARGHVGIEGDTLRLTLRGHLNREFPVAPTTMDPAWLAPIPRESAGAAVVLAIDSRPAFRDHLFSVVDRVERSIPERAQVAPSRVRFGLLALSVGIRTETDLWPHLTGLTAVALNPQAEADGFLVALHMDGPESAENLVARAGGTALGRKLAATRRGTMILVGSSPAALEQGLRALDRSRETIAWAGFDPTNPPQRMAWVWPGRWLTNQGALGQAWTDSPPIVWRGTWGGAQTSDEIVWPGWRKAVHRFLDALPLRPPPSDEAAIKAPGRT